MGHGTSSNFWNSGNDGVRITVVNASSGTAVSSPLDFSNRTQKTSLLHFGKVNKLQYLGGTGLSLQSGVAYSCIRPTQSMPCLLYTSVTRLDMERGVAVGIITRIIRQNL